MTNQNESSSADDDARLLDNEDTEGAEQESTEGADDEGKEETPTAPPERTFTQEEWDKRQSKIDKQIADLRKQSEEAIRKVQEEAEAAAEAAAQKRDQVFIDKVEADGGDINAAKQLVAREQAIRKQEQDFAKRRREFDGRIAEAFEVAKRNDAERLAHQYKVDVDPLLEAENPTEMELIASKLALEKAKTKQKPPVKTDSNLPSAKGANLSKLTPSEKIREGIKDMEGLQ